MDKFSFHALFQIVFQTGKGWNLAQRGKITDIGDDAVNRLGFLLAELLETAATGLAGVTQILKQKILGIGTLFYPRAGQDGQRYLTAGIAGSLPNGGFIKQ